MYDEARENIADFFGAAKSDEIIFTSGTTESANLIAFGWGEKNLKPHDEILVLLSEHHSNFVPWQEIAKRKNAKLIVENIQPDYSYNFTEMYKKKPHFLINFAWNFVDEIITQNKKFLKSGT